MRVFYWHSNRVRTNPIGDWPRTTPLVSEMDFYFSEVATHHISGCYQTIPVRVCVVIDDTMKFTHAEGAFDDKTIFSFNIDPLYKQCCGLREIGTFHYRYKHGFLGRIPEVIKAIEESFSTSNLFSNIGALTYTLVKYKSGEYFDEKAAAFVKAWPGASAGEWWYNPNSGNFVQIWTLPINQALINVNEDDEIEDED